MAIVFPATPLLGELYPPNPGLPGQGQWEWDGTKWSSVLSTVSLGNSNQGVYNNYEWPATAGPAGNQLTTDGFGNLSWGLPAASAIEMLALDRPFNGSDVDYTLLRSGTVIPFSPNPSTNIVVFLGGVPQIPMIAYTISGSTITFDSPPPLGTTFYAISNVAI